MLISFLIKPSWLYLLTLGMLLKIVLFVAYYKKRLRKQETQMGEKITHLQTAVFGLQHTINQLNTSETELMQSISLKSNITSLVLHDLQPPLSFLEKIANDAFRNSSQKNLAKLQENLYELHTGVRNMASYAQNLLLWTDTQKEVVENKNSYFNLHTFIGEIINNSPINIDKNNIAIINKVDTRTSINSNPEMLKIIIQSLYENALNHTEKGTITLSAEIINNEFIILITDTGNGMNYKNVNHSLYADNNLVSDTEFHLKFKFIKELIKKINGVLEINSAVGKGTTVKIAFKNF